MSDVNCYVYEHWRPDTGLPFYVGKGSGNRSHTLDGRNSYHRNVVRKLVKNGLNFEVRIIAKGLTHEEAFDLEIKRIAFWRSQGIRLTNLAGGGKGGSNPSEETKAKISVNNLGKNKGRKRSEGFKNGVSLFHKGRKRSDETKAKLSASLKGVGKGRKLSEEHKEKVGAFHTGRKRPPETGAKISASLRGRKLSDETKAKISAVQKGKEGKKHSEESKAKMSVAAKGRTFSDETKERMSIAAKARKHSEETKAKMSAARKGRQVPGDGMKGKRHSEESKIKMREARLRYLESLKLQELSP
jgi:hypothetical protein